MDLTNIAGKEILPTIYKDIFLWLSANYTDLTLCSFSLSLLLPSLIAVEDCYKGLDKDPFNGDFHFTLYNLLKFNREASLFHLEKAVESNQEKYSFLYFSSGSEFYSRGEFNLSKKYLWKSVELNPPDRDACVLLGEIYRKENKFNTSVKIFKKGLKFYPDYPVYYILMGTALLNNGSIKQGLPYFLSLIETENDFTELALFKAGLCCLMIGHYDRAVEYWTELSLKYPSNPRGPYALEFMRKEISEW
jgi:tetratricopeptide (TPR) repeat protein